MIVLIMDYSSIAQGNRVNSILTTKSVSILTQTPADVFMDFITQII